MAPAERRSRVRPIARLRAVASLVRLRPYNVSTEEGRSKERARRAALTSLSSMFARGMTIVTALISVPLTIGYLGTERYGLWLTISSVFAFATAADLGVTQGLQNLISRAHGRGDSQAAHRAISSAAAILLASATVMGALFLIFYPVVPWPRLFNVEGALAAAEASHATLVFAAVWLVNLVLALVIRVNLAYQDGFRNNLWQALGSLLSLVAVIVAIRYEAGLPVLVLALTGGSAVATALNGVTLFWRQRPEVRPSFREVDRSTTRQLLRAGFWFLVLALGYQAFMHSSNLVIAHTIGTDGVPEFAVPARVAAVLNMLLALLVNPLWPAYSESIARGDHRWARLALRRSLQISTVVAVVPAIILVVTGQQLVRWWVGAAVSPSLSLLAGLAAWTVLVGVGNALNVFLFGNDAVRFQAIARAAQAMVIVPVQVVFIRWFGLAGVGWALFVVELFVRFIPAALQSRRLAHRLIPLPTETGA